MTTSEHMPFVYDDGGRRLNPSHGQKSRGDCVVRAIAIAMQRPYAEVWRELSDNQLTQRRSKHSKRGHNASSGVSTRRKWFKDYMHAHGWRWVTCMRIGQGCRVHLVKGELPMGRLIVAVSRHYTAVIDGVIRDTYDSQRRTYWYKQGTTQIERISERCVYGYWQKAS